MYKLTSTSCGIRCLTRDITPIFFDIFLDIAFICSFHVRCSSMLTPRNLVDDTLEIHWLSILTDMLQFDAAALFRFEQNRINFVFSRFTDSLLALNHSPTSFISVLILLTNTSIDLCDMNTLVSSASITK